MKEDHSAAVREVVKKVASFADDRFEVNAHYAEYDLGKVKLTLYCSKDGKSARNFEFGFSPDVLSTSDFCSQLAHKCFLLIDKAYANGKV